jgi:hypothetical protein
MSNPRAARYRRLALLETDPERAQLLRLIADEADQGVLCVSTPTKASALQSSPSSPVTPAS